MNMITARDAKVAQLFAPERINDFYNLASISHDGQELTALLLSPMGVQAVLELGMKIPKQYLVPPWVTKEDALKRFKALTNLTLKAGHGKFPMYNICQCIHCSYAEKARKAGFDDEPPAEVFMHFIPETPTLKLELEMLRQALLEHCASILATDINVEKVTTF